MSTAGDKEFALAKVYAAALLQLGKATGLADVVADELRGFADFVQKDDVFRSFMDSPTVGVRARTLMIEKLFRGKYSDVLVDALQVLNRNERLSLIADVAHAYHLLHEEWKGRVEVDVQTAVPLSDGLRKRLQSTLSRTTGKQVDLVESIDESLIGGMIVRIGDDKFDGSVRRKLVTVAGALMERASRELHGGRTYTVGAAS
jgi:F-type H+-transporting ATPase subunit delta